jgi:hypothetical protein
MAHYYIERDDPKEIILKDMSVIPTLKGKFLPIIKLNKDLTIEQ